MRKKTGQSHWNNVRRQRFHNKRALARTRYEAFGATEGFGKDECFQSLFGISSKMREIVARRAITTLKAGIEPSKWAWDSLTPRLQNSCSICARSRVSLKTALQEYAQEKFCQSMPKWSVTTSVFSTFSTISKTLICCLF